MSTVPGVPWHTRGETEQCNGKIPASDSNLGHCHLPATRHGQAFYFFASQFLHLLQGNNTVQGHSED